MKDIQKKTVYLDMKSIFISIFCALAVPLMATNELDIELNKFYVANKVIPEKIIVDDYTIVRRIYIDIAGRIPKFQEIEEFVKSKVPNKRIILIDKILNSEDYTNNFYNFWADILRIRTDRLSDDIGFLKSYPYIDYVKDFIRTDKPYNKFVNELLTSTGDVTTNPATSYLIKDVAMPLDNLANTAQIFVATDVQCAQCHSSPFDKWTQKQFYELAAFFGSTEYRTNRKDYSEFIKKIDQQIKDITKQDRINNQVRQLISSNLFDSRYVSTKNLKLPFDFKYLEEGKPNEIVKPVSLDGTIKVESGDPRPKFAEWILNHKNFTPALSNRIWDFVIGTPLTIPITNFDIETCKNKEILTFLGKYFQSKNYSIKTLIRLIVTSDFYTRKAYTGTDYNLQAPLIKRMTAYQIWDSILTLFLPDVNYTRINYSKYSELVKINFDTINGGDLLKRMDEISAYEKSLSVNFLNFKGIDLVRSAFITNKNGFVGLLLKEFGASERVLIDSSNNDGSITQMLIFMNSDLASNLYDFNSELMQNFERNNKNKEVIFISMLSHPPSFFEKDTIIKSNYKDLVWALLNSKDFLFKK